MDSGSTEIHPYLSSDAKTKDGGFERFGIFKNQGDCVSYVATQGGNTPG